MLSCVFGAYWNMPMIVNKVLSFIYNKWRLLICHTLSFIRLSITQAWDYNSPKPDYNSPTPDYNSLTPDYNSPTPDYNSPTPDYNSLTPDYNSPTQYYNSPTPDYKSPTPDPTGRRKHGF